MQILLSWMWQGALVAGVTEGLLGCLTRVRAGDRYALCAAAWTAVLLLPVLNAITPTITISSHWIAPSPLTDGGGSASGPAWTWTWLLLAVWATWMAIRATQVVRAMHTVRRIRQSATLLPISMEAGLTNRRHVPGASRPAALVVSQDVDAAGVLFGRFPMIALSPAMFDVLTCEEIDQVILHEQAHVERRDDLFNLLVIAGDVVAGWHPAIWWLKRRLHLERERACDELVVARTGEAKAYARCLTELAARLRERHSIAVVPGMFTVSMVTRRVVHVLKLHSLLSSSLSRALSAGAASMLGVLVFGMTSIGLIAEPLAASRATLAGPAVAVIASVMPVASPRAPGTSVPGASRAAQSTTTAGRESSASMPQLETSAGIADPTPQTAASETTQAHSQPILPAAMSHQTSPLPASSAVTLGAPPPAVPSDAERSPWMQAADRGVAVGRGSQRAAVATAGAVTRFAKRLAGSFNDN